MKRRDRTRRFFARPLGGAFAARTWHVPRWLWLVVLLWLAWVTVLSDHSFWRIAQLKRQIASAERETRDLQRATGELEVELSDPYVRRFRAEEIARTQHGWAAPGEIVYRFRGQAARGDTAR
jgi:cell division protein FtsB